MKIICVEEHTSDPDLRTAGQPKQKAEAGYFTEVGSDFSGSLNDGDDKLPKTMNFQTSTKLLADVGAGRLAMMDEHGIDMQILSYSDASQNVPADQQVQLTRQANDRLAQVVRANPSRFGGFSCLPWAHPEAAAEELERSVKELGFVGALLLGRPADTFLDDDRFEPILAKLNELRVPLYLHPGPPLPEVQQPYYRGLGTQVSARLSLFGWGWHSEAGVHLLRLLLSKKFDQFPNLQVICGHWGEMVPFFLDRLDDSIPQVVTGLSRSIKETFKQHVYVTPSGMLTLPQFEFIQKVVGVDRILYSVDYPYLTLAGARRFLESLAISQEDKDKMAHGNAERLFQM